MAPRLYALVFLLACTSSGLPTDPITPDGGPGNGPADTAAADGPASPDAPPAPACGGPGEACCTSNACNSGGCCHAGRCVAEGATCAPLDARCMAGACGTCGGTGQPCCPGQLCTAGGTACIKNFCARCGGQVGEQCCPPPPGSPIGSNGLCSKPTLTCDPATAFCTSCGTPGGACCTGDVCAGGACCFGGNCVGPGQTCGVPSSMAGTCTGGSCSGCGSANQPCCGGGDTATCGPGLTCQDSRCIGCGGTGQTCCPASATRPACNSGNSCGPDNTCGKCGGPGEPCCAGSMCAGGGCCFTGKCVGTGTQCTYEGKSYGSCTGSKCKCGAVGEPCCPGTVENGFQNWTCSDPSASCAEPAGTANVRTCTQCGVVGGPCCSDKSCREKGTSCLAMPPEGYRCRKCGGSGDPCCVQRGVPDPFCDGTLNPGEDPVTHRCTCG